VTIPVAFEDVRFTYPDGTPALDGVTLELPAGSRVAIVGQNGSGKSTLVRHLNGLLRPTKGRVTHGGRGIEDRHVADLARTVGLVFQDPDRQIFAGRVRAEVAFGPRNLGRRGADVDRVVDAALTAVGLAGESETNPYDLGFSRRKLLALASVLAMETPVLVLDEPTTGQDARGIALVQAIVGNIAATGRTVIAISHDMRFVAESFERVVAMRQGRILLDGTPASVFDPANREALATTFLEPPLPARVGARLGLGSTPTEAALLAALSRGAGDRGGGDRGAGDGGASDRGTGDGGTAKGWTAGEPPAIA
jgi:energy-coupling factor transport system ATP-binding protein